MRLPWFITPLVPYLAAGVLFAQDSPRYQPPACSADTAVLVAAARDELQRGDPAAAVGRLYDLSRDHTDELLPLDGEGIVSASAWVAAAGETGGQAISAEYRKAFESKAAAAMDQVRQDPLWTPESMYTLARQYPFSATAGRAYAEAAERHIQLGDLFAATACCQLARQAGGQISDARDQQLKAWFAALDPARNYRGAMAFQAPWYGRLDRVGVARCIPCATDGMLYFAGPRHVLAVRNGQVVWRWLSPEAWLPALSGDQPRLGRGAVFNIATFTSPSGTQILVVRQPRAVGQAFCLRALRASDGKLLWGTDNVAGFAGVSFLGGAAVAGRYVYAPAIEPTDASARLLLIGLDLLDGHLLFKTTLGTLPHLNPRPERRRWDDIWSQTEPAVAGDTVYLSPGVGAAFAVGRFDGMLRWVRMYDPALRGAAGQQPAAQADRAMRPPAPPPVDARRLLRWRSTPQVCGRVVVIAPQDTPAVYGLDTTTGRILWTQASSPAENLIGGTDDCAIFAGGLVAALDASTGKRRWQYDAGRLAYVVGPPTVSNGVVYVPASDQHVHAISASTGRGVLDAPKMPDLRQILASSTIRSLLEEAQVVREPVP